MADRNLSLGVDTDDASINRAKKSVSSINDVIEKMREHFSRAEKETDNVKKSLDAVSKSVDNTRDKFKDGEIQLDKTKKAFTELEKEANDLGTALDNAIDKPRNLNVDTSRFDTVSKNVSLAGDAESNLRAVGGAFGAAGATGASQAIGAVAEIPAVIEALPRLREAAAGLPSAIGAAAESLGTGGIALTAFAAVAIAVFSAISAEAQKEADKFTAYIDSFRETNQAIADGTLTTDQARDRIEELNRKREAEQELLDTLQAAYDASYNSLDPLTAAEKKLTDAREEAASEQIKKSIDAVNAYGSEIDNLTEAMKDGKLSAADAADAERKLAEERTRAVLDAAALEGDLTELRLHAADQTKEQIEAQIKEIEIQIAARQAEIDAIKASGDTSEEAKKRIKELTDQIDNLGARSEVLSDVASTAQSEDDIAQARAESKAATEEATQAEVEATATQKVATDATRDMEQAQKDAAKAAEQAQAAQQKYNDALKQADTRFQEAVQDIGTDLKDKLVDVGIGANQEFVDLQTEFDRDEAQRAREQGRNLAKIRDDAGKEEKDALRRRDFAALADSRDAREQAKKDAITEFEQEGQDRLIEAANQRQDIVTEAQRQTQDLGRENQRQLRDAELTRDRARAAARDQLNSTEQTYKGISQMTAQWGQNMLAQFQQIYGQLNPAFAGSVGSASGRNITERTIDSRFRQLTSRNNRFGDGLDTP